MTRVTKLRNGARIVTTKHEGERYTTLTYRLEQPKRKRNG